MDKLAGIVGKKVGEAVEDAVKGALGFGDKQKSKDKKKGGGGIFSRFGDDHDKNKGDKKDTGGLFNRDDKDEKERNAGFRGLFTEGPAASGDGDRAATEAGSEERPEPESVAASDRDLLDDLMDVAEETSRGRELQPDL